MELGSKHGSRSREGERGQAIAELACIAPLVLLILVGLIEAGRFANFSIMVANAARAGVQYGAQNLVTAADTTGMQSAAAADAQNVSGLSTTASYFCKCADGSASSCLPSDCPTNHRITYVQVNATGTFSSLLHLASMRPSVTVASSATMRVSQ